MAAAFALYALLSESLGPAGAAAVVAGVAALLMAIGALVALLMARPPKRRENDSFAARALDYAREKPVVAIAAAAAAGLIAVRNPKLITAALTAFLAGKAADK
jgi:cobalamin synthase